MKKSKNKILNGRENKFLKTAILTLTMMSVISGCDKDKTGTEETSSKNQETVVQEQETKTGLQMLFGDEKWVEKWTVAGKDGTELVIDIDAEVSLPELDNMSVVEIENLPCTSENKEQFLKGIFDENCIFLNDDEHKTKDQWQKEIDKLVRGEIYWWDDGGGYANEQVEQDVKNKIQRLYNQKAEYEEKMNTASTEYTEATVFDGDYYIGYIDGKLYTVTFWKVGDDSDGSGGLISEYISIESSDYTQPSELEDAFGIYTIPDSSTHPELEGEKNQCQISEEEAKAYAEKYLNAIGIPNAVCTYIDDLCWRGDRKMTEESSEYEEVKILDGYKMEFAVGVDDFSLRYSEEIYEELDGLWSTLNGYSMETYVTVEVNDYGIVSMKVKNPIKINNISGNVELLPLSDICKIMTDTMNENADDYGVVEGKWDKNGTIFNRMDLMYFRVTDRKKENHYSYVPAWRVSINETYKELIVNAIDGSVINLVDELSVKY